MKIGIIGLIIALLLESFVTTLPLTVCVIIFLAATLRRNEVFALAFFSGLFLDIFSFGRIGLSSLYFLICVQLIFLYEKKFELESPHFVFFATLAGAFGYLLISGREIILGTATVAIISGVSFFVFSLKNKKIPSYA